MNKEPNICKDCLYKETKLGKVIYKNCVHITKYMLENNKCYRKYTKDKNNV